MPDRYWLCDATCTTDCGACKGEGPPPVADQVERERDAVLLEGDWVSPRREAHARDLLKPWADAASNAGCPEAFVERMRRHVELHDRLARAALAARGPRADAEEAVARVRRFMETAPVVQFANGYPVKAVPVSDLLSALAALGHPT